MVNIANKECGFEHEILSYMYDELGAVERTQFETHLVGCTSCTDEFAAVSFSRFSVFEWQREQFAPLATPKIVLPFEDRSVPVKSAGWFVGLTELFAFARSPLAVGAAFAVVLAVGAIGFNWVGTGGSEIASNNVPPIVIEQKVEPTKVANLPVVTVVEDAIESDQFRPATTATREIKPKTARQTSQPRRIVDDRTVPNSTRQARRAPVLNDLGDDDEDSLRLSDMFDEIGG